MIDTITADNATLYWMMAWKVDAQIDRHSYTYAYKCTYSAPRWIYGGNVCQLALVTHIPENVSGS